jgi:microcystin-dependent protein
MVGLDGSDPLFDTLQETGGSKDAVVVSHTHTADTAGSHSHTTSIERFLNYSADAFIPPQNVFQQNAGNATALPSSTAGDHTHTISTTGSSGTNANLQPYITVAMWRRTA